jgi:glycerol 3-phosphatase-1
MQKDVLHGKPDPECYRLGRSRLNLSPQSAPSSPEASDTPILVVEDAPAGVKAGRAAGCQVLGLLTTHTEKQIRDAGATWVVKDLGDVKFVSFNLETEQVELEFEAVLENE